MDECKIISCCYKVDQRFWRYFLEVLVCQMKKALLDISTLEDEMKAGKHGITRHPSMTPPPTHPSQTSEVTHDTGI